MLNDISAQLQDRVRAAVAAATPLCIVGGDSKAFYGRAPIGERVELGEHRGIVNYEPTELVISARAGTPLRLIEDTLAGEQQMLAFEPSHFGEAATLGGTIACNLSGPRRPYAGAARDFVLGTRVINGKAEVLAFGGEVMKNVAGYDVSRLMTGAMGTLGILLEISLKTLPRPEVELTLAQSLPVQDALERMHAWGRLPLPISATCYDGSQLLVRLSGTAGAVDAARGRIGGDAIEAGDSLWEGLREHRHPFFASERPLWRLSLASTTPPLALQGDWLYEWGGAQRWLASEEPAAAVHAAAKQAGGHATLYRNMAAAREAIFQPLPAELMTLHKRLKQAFDPAGIFNPGRMYPEL
jgi:glycolate oxidase FAD binding subunit